MEKLEKGVGEPEKSPEKKEGKMDYLALADELDELQKQKNKGRGVSCIQGIIIYLRAGDIERAKIYCHTDHDKISNYPDILELLKNKLFADDEEHPWSFEERWESQRKKS